LGIVAFSLQEICHIWRHMGRSSIMLFDTRTNQRRVLIWESIFNRSRARDNGNKTKIIRRGTHGR